MASGSPKYKISRTLGCNLWGREKDPYNFKNYYPGQHGRTVMRSNSQYAKQLKAKQKLRFYYNMREEQFRRFFKMALAERGDTGQNLIRSLERRLDAVIYRANIASTIFAAAQLISHGHILVDGKRVNCRSYLVKIGQVVSVSDSAKNHEQIVASLAKKVRHIPEYMKFDEQSSSICFLRYPSSKEVPYECSVDPALVVEYYSK